MNLVNEVKPIILNVIMQTGADTLLFGGALGWDKIAFYACLDLKKSLKNLRLIHCVPFEEQPISWVTNRTADRYFSINEDLTYRPLDVLLEIVEPGMYGYETLQDYKDMLSRSDEVIYVDQKVNTILDVPVGRYHPAKMQKRNEFMVDNANYGISLYNGAPKGGTYNCIKYAKQKGRKLYNINPAYLKKDVTEETSEEIVHQVLKKYRVV
jgi:uncharacterized phage-like protein YoqJ